MAVIGISFPLHGPREAVRKLVAWRSVKTESSPAMPAEGDAPAAGKSYMTVLPGMVAPFTERAREAADRAGLLWTEPDGSPAGEQQVALVRSEAEVARRQAGEALGLIPRVGETAATMSADDLAGMAAALADVSNAYRAALDAAHIEVRLASR